MIKICKDCGGNVWGIGDLMSPETITNKCMKCGRIISVETEKYEAI